MRRRAVDISVLCRNLEQELQGLLLTHLLAGLSKLRIEIDEEKRADESWNAAVDRAEASVLPRKRRTKRRTAKRVTKRVTKRAKQTEERAKFVSWPLTMQKPGTVPALSPSAMRKLKRRVKPVEA